MLHRSSLQQTAEVFFLYPTKRQYLIDISRNIKLAHTSVKKNLKTLLKSEIISESIEKRGKREFPLYTANTNSKSYKKHKLIYNLSSIMESNLITFIEEKLMPKSIVLFGSYKRGEDLENSDIDLFIECTEEKLELKPFEKKLKRKIQPHFKEDFKTYTKELKNNILNGFVLSGFLEGYK